MIDVWHYAAPNIDFLAPDLYDKGFVDWVAKYKLHNNPLFIPEIRLEDNDGVRAFYVFGEHDAIGFCPFSIESGSDRADAPLVQSYIKLKELMPLLTKYQGKGVMNGLLFDEENKERILSYDDLEITCRHYFTLPWDPAFAAYLSKKRAEGKHYNVALSHATKKLVRLIFAMEKSRMPYCPAA